MVTNFCRYPLVGRKHQNQKASYTPDLTGKSLGTLQPDIYRKAPNPQIFDSYVQMRHESHCNNHYVWDTVYLLLCNLVAKTIDSSETMKRHANII